MVVTRSDRTLYMK